MFKVNHWKCRVCGFDRYYQVTVMRKNHIPYVTAFFACSQCSVMFENIARFNAWNTEPVADVRPSQEFKVGKTR